MATNAGRRSGSRTAAHTAVGHGGADRSAALDEKTRPTLDTKYLTPCPVCGDGTADATWKLNHDGFPDWRVGCFLASCKALGGYWIEEAGQAFGLGEGATKEMVAAAIRRRARAPRHLNGRPAEPWSEAKRAGWAHRLLAEPNALHYLKTRGLTVETITKLGIGYAPKGTGTKPWPDLAAFVFPCHKKRFWPTVPTSAHGKAAKCVGLPGSRAVLWPKVPPGRRLLVCEGELDAAILRQYAFPAVTSTAGTSWNPDWNRHIRGRVVAVIYDTGSASLALGRRRAREFVAAGAIDAWAVDLALPEKGDDVTDWFATYGRSAEELRDLINASRRLQR